VEQLSVSQSDPETVEGDNVFIKTRKPAAVLGLSQ
jgi:hypothetical protein